MEVIVEQINQMGKGFVDFSLPMLIQSSVLIIFLVIIDFLLRKRVRAVFRYFLWMLVLIKLVLPTSITSPVGIGNFTGDLLTNTILSATEKTTAENPTIIVPEIQNPKPELYKEIEPWGIDIRSLEYKQQQPEVVFKEKPMPPANQQAPLQQSVSITWQGAVFIGWLAIVFAMALLLIQRFFFVRGLVRQSKLITGGINDLLQSYCRQLGIKRKITIRKSTNATSPAVCGLFRLIILLPENLTSRLNRLQLKAILLHELTHIRRGDLWVNLAQTLLQIIYFYNPFFWLANSIIRRVREQAVDEAVQVALAESAHSYPQILVDVAKIAFKRPSLGLRLIGVVESKSALKTRIARMLSRPIPKKAKLGILSLLAIIIIGIILLPMASARNEENTTDPEKPKFEATLPNGVTVELAGTCQYTEDGVNCYRPDGLPLDRNLKITKWNQKPKVGDVGIMLKVSGPEDMSFSYDKIQGAKGWEGSCQVVDENGQELGGWEAALTRFDSNQMTTTAKFGAAAGAWKTVAENDGRSMGIVNGISFTTATETEKGVQIFTTDTLGRDVTQRIVAIDDKGKLHPWKGYTGSVSNSQIRQSIGTFPNLKLDKIEKYQFQIRSYQWIEFRNVSLKPNFKTDVQIEIKAPDNSIEGQKPGVLASDKLKNAERMAEVTFKKGTPIRDALQFIASTYKKNIIISDKVSGEVPITELYDVTFEELLEAILGTNKYVVDGNFIRVYTAEEFESLYPNFESGVKIEDPAGQGEGKSDFVKNSAFYTSIITRKIYDTSNGKDCFIDFDKDKIYSIPKGFYSWPKMEQQKWIIENGIDVSADTSEGEEGLWGEQIFVLPLPNDAFDVATPALFKGLESSKPAVPSVMTAIGDLPKTYLFKTREGGLGLLQILEVQREQEPHWLKIRYKKVPKTSEAEARMISNEKLQDLGKAMALFEHEKNVPLPDRMEEFGPFFGDPNEIEWLNDNVQYVGKGKTGHDRPDAVIAYDKVLLKSGKGTNVLYNDAHVEYCSPQRLKILGTIEGVNFDEQAEDSDIIGGVMTVKQRSNQAIPGTDGKLEIHIGDITAGQVEFSVLEDKQKIILPQQSIKTGDVLTFEYENQSYNIKVIKLINYVIGDDEAIFEISNVTSPGKDEGEEFIKAENLVWGPDVNGLRAAVQFIPEEQSYSLGEIIKIRFHIQNVSSHIISFSTERWRNDVTQCFLEDSQGKVIPCINILFLGDPIFVQKKLQPGEVTTIESASLGITEDYKESKNISFPAGNIAVAKPGQYKLYYELRFRDVLSQNAQGETIFPKPEDWRGKLVTGKRNFIISLQPKENSAAQAEQSGNEEYQIIGFMKSDSNNVGTITAIYGSAMCGNNIRYTPSLYLGRIERYNKIELIDPNVILNQFGIPTIKIKTVTENPTVPAGSIGWVQLSETSFTDRFIANKNVSLVPGQKTNVPIDSENSAGQTKVTENFLRPLRPDDPRETGDLEAKPLPDGRLRISPMRQWSQTHLELSEGQRLEIESEGSVNGCQKPVNGWAYGPWGPAGGPSDRDPNIKVCALIGKIVGETETREFFVGEKFQMKVPFDGKLYLGVSDIWHFDNSGEFVATVKIDGKQVDFTKYQTAKKDDAPKADVLSENYRLMVESVPGKLVFHGQYQHRSRGNEIETPSELWLKQDASGSINALAYLPWMGSYDLAKGDQENRLISYKTAGEATESRKGYLVELKLQDGKALLTRNGVREDRNNSELAVPKGTSFNPNSRPDSYCADNILLRRLNLKPGEKKELRVYDWDEAGEKLVDYSIQITHTGKERIIVPAGTFEANHYMLTQVSSANTWFKKRAGHVTDYWVLDNNIIVRVLRHREPYEMELLDYTYPEDIGEKTGIEIETEKPSGQGEGKFEDEDAKFRAVDFEGYFADSAAGGEMLEQLWNDRNKDLRDADEILEIVRNGLRRYKGRGNILRWIGNLFIWGKNPQNEKAIELMYHASGSPDRGLYGDAIYFGLSVTQNKTPEILEAMVAVAMKTDDYYNVTGRILWGARSQKDELIACLEPYLNSDDVATRQKAQDVKDYFADSDAFMAKRAKEYEESVRKEYGNRLGELNEKLLKGNSKTRLETLKEMQSKGIMTIVDESFLEAFGACTKDSDRQVRTTAARMMGNKFVWGGNPQNPMAIEILTELLDEPDHSTRYAAVYYGLSTVRDPNKELVSKMLETILDDREINYYGRVIWGIRRNKQACIETLEQWMGQSQQDKQRALKAYEIYEDVTAQQLPEEYAERFAGQKSDAHEGLVTMCIPVNPAGKEEVQKQLLELLAGGDMLKKISDFYIIEGRETAVGMFICDNLADRNAIRDVLTKDNVFQVEGYMHGRIGPTGSGWIDSLKTFRERNEPYRISLQR